MSKKESKKEKTIQQWGDEVWFNIETLYDPETKYARITRAMLVEGIGVVLSTINRFQDENEIDVMTETTELIHGAVVVTYIRNEEVEGRRVVGANVMPQKATPGTNFFFDRDKAEEAARKAQAEAEAEEAQDSPVEDIEIIKDEAPVKKRRERGRSKTKLAAVSDSE